MANKRELSLYEWTKLHQKYVNGEKVTNAELLKAIMDLNTRLEELEEDKDAAIDIKKPGA